MVLACLSKLTISSLPVSLASLITTPCPAKFSSAICPGLNIEPRSWMNFSRTLRPWVCQYSKSCCDMPLSDRNSVNFA